MDELRYLTDHYDAKIERIKKIGAPLNFVFITDQHNRLNEFFSQGRQYELAANHIRSIQYLLDRCPEISFVISGGDIGNDYDPDPDKMRESYREVYDALYSLSVPAHCVIGNHDDGLGNAFDRGDEPNPHAVLPEEMHELCMKYNPTKENYYYFDTPQGYRFVLLNTSDKPFGYDRDGNIIRECGWRLEISIKQCEWLEREALKTDNKIIIISHSPLHNAGLYGTEGIHPSNLRDGIKPFDDTFNAPRAYWDVHQSKNVIAMICGHIHFDNLIYDEDIVTVSTLSSFAQVWAPSSPAREFGAITETAFDVFSIKDSMLYITRFGAGDDRQAHLLRA